MGCDKAELEYRGPSLLALQVETLKELKPRELFISGRTGLDDTPALMLPERDWGVRGANDGSGF